MRLRDVLLSKLDFAHESPATTSPWLEPPFAAPSGPNVLDTPRGQRTPEEIAAFLKSRFRPAPAAGERPKEMRWVTICLTAEPTEDTMQTYPKWVACVSLYISVDILTNNDGIRHFGFEGQLSSTARVLHVLIACGLQHLLEAPPPDHTVDLEAVTELAESFSFSEVRKRTLQS